MRVHLISLTLVLVLMDNIMANPLLEGGPAARTLFQQNMKCNTRSTYKRITTLTETVTREANTKTCLYTIRAYNTKVCQVRIDFRIFELQEPGTTSATQHAHCNGDRLRITRNGNRVVTFDLCGSLSTQHVYVPFDVQKLADELEIEYRVVSSNRISMWQMEINQIECAEKASIVKPDERQAPDGCLQYFYNSTGWVESFNFERAQYIGDTNYAICFDRNNYRYAVLKLTDIEFEMDSIDATVDDGFDINCLDAQPAAAASKDFIAIPFAELDSGDRHSLFCGTSLDQKELSFRGTGPIVIHVNTDRRPPDAVKRGFRFQYEITNDQP